MRNAARGIKTSDSSIKFSRWKMEVKWISDVKCTVVETLGIPWGTPPVLPWHRCGIKQLRTIALKSEKNILHLIVLHLSRSNLGYVDNFLGIFGLSSNILNCCMSCLASALSFQNIKNIERRGKESNFLDALQQNSSSPWHFLRLFFIESLNKIRPRLRDPAS